VAPHLGNCNWHGGGNVNVNVNQYNNFNKTNINNANWNHNVEHRRVVLSRPEWRSSTTACQRAERQGA
jgi:hypothetical protein